MCHTSASDEAVKLNIIELGLFAIVFLEGYFESDNVNGASFQPGAESCVTCASLTHIHTARAFERETSSSSPPPSSFHIIFFYSINASPPQATCHLLTPSTPMAAAAAALCVFSFFPFVAFVLSLDAICGSALPFKATARA